MKVTQKSFNFARKFSLPFYFVSAADGTNVVKVRWVFACWAWCPRGPLAAQGHGGCLGTESRKWSIISAPCEWLCRAAEGFFPWDVGTVSICYRNPVPVCPIL